MDDDKPIGPLSLVVDGRAIRVWRFPKDAGCSLDDFIGRIGYAVDPAPQIPPDLGRLRRIADA